MDCPISAETATNLYAALLTDTGSFRHENTTEAALRLGADLVALGANAGWVALKSYKSRSIPQLRLEGMATATARSESGGRLVWSEITRAMLEESGATLAEAEGVIDQLQTVDGLKIAVIFKEAGPELIKVSVRSRDEVDSTQVCSPFGGGGHRRAAGAELHEPLEDRPRARSGGRPRPAAVAAVVMMAPPVTPPRRGVPSAVLALNKQPGQTSFDCVRQVRRIYGERRVGHAGTLDPMAQGLLPLCLGVAHPAGGPLPSPDQALPLHGQAGRALEHPGHRGGGHPRRGRGELDAATVAAALRQFVGEISQVPPMHSAVRHEGEHLYELARRGEEVERAPRLALIVSAELVGFRPGAVAEADLDVECGKGTFMRVLAGDLGDALGVGGLLSWLERTHYGSLDLADAHTIEELQRMDDPTLALLPPRGRGELPPGRLPRPPRRHPGAQRPGGLPAPGRRGPPPGRGPSPRRGRRAGRARRGHRVPLPAHQGDGRLSDDVSDDLMPGPHPCP